MQLITPPISSLVSTCIYDRQYALLKKDRPSRETAALITAHEPRSQATHMPLRLLSRPHGILLSLPAKLLLVVKMTSHASDKFMMFGEVDDLMV